MSTNIPKLHFPLMAVITYKGFRIIAESVVPINKSTICYGSDDCGKTVHADNPEFNQVMKQVAAKINLKGHVTGCGPSSRYLYAPGDIEGHLGLDNRFYLIDFARLMPPEAPKEGILSLKEKRCVFYKMYALNMESDQQAATGAGSKMEIPFE